MSLSLKASVFLRVSVFLIKALVAQSSVFVVFEHTDGSEEE